MLDDGLLKAYIDGFYGYGSYQAPYWFIGMEPGGEVTLDEMEARLQTWDGAGRPELEELRGYHGKIGGSHYNVENPSIHVYQLFPRGRAT